MSKNNGSGDPFAKFAEEARADDEPVVVEIVDRKGDPYVRADGSHVTITVLGKFSSQVQKLERRLTDKIIKEQRRRTLDATDAEDRYAERLAGACTAWTIEDADGKPVPFTTQNVVTFLKIAPWVAPQLTQAIEAHEHFFVKPSGS